MRGTSAPRETGRSLRSGQAQVIGSSHVGAACKAGAPCQTPVTARRNGLVGGADRDITLHTIGCLVCHVVACSYANAMRQSVASVSLSPMNWIVYGIPFRS